MDIQGPPLHTSLQGIQNGFDRLGKHSAEIASPNNPHLENSLIGHKLDANQVQASTKAAKTENEMIGTLIDIMA